MIHLHDIIMTLESRNHGSWQLNISQNRDGKQLKSTPPSPISQTRPSRQILSFWVSRPKQVVWIACPQGGTKTLGTVTGMVNCSPSKMPQLEPQRIGSVLEPLHQMGLKRYDHPDSVGYPFLVLVSGNRSVQKTSKNNCMTYSVSSGFDIYNSVG